MLSFCPLIGILFRIDFLPNLDVLLKEIEINNDTL